MCNHLSCLNAILFISLVDCDCACESAIKCTYRKLKRYNLPSVTKVNVSFMMSLTTRKGNFGFIDLKKKVKLESVVSSFVKPLYGEKPNITLDRKNPVSRKKIYEKYQNKKLHPKRLKLGRDFEEHEVEALFGPCIS